MPQLCTFGAASGRGFGLTEEISGPSEDGQFNLTTLLLPGNGTNGAQNNTFLDSSASPLTLTRNGNPTQGTFSPFSFGSGTQANGYYSGYFDGTGDYLNKTSGTITLSGNFTIEYWMYPTSLGSYPTTYSTFNAVNAANAIYAQFGNNSATFIFQCGNGSADGTIGSYTATLNAWQHHAIVRSGTTVTAYVNGVSVGTRTSSVAFDLTSLGVGAYTGALAGTYPFFGYISNFRVVNGTAVYTSTFTPPTSPLTAISGTSLLTCQSSRFIDNSTNAFTITVNGNSQPVPTNPFGMTDWSGYFDGTGDYLTVANNAAFDLGSGDATIEAWIYPTSSGQTCGIFDKRSSGANYSQFPQVALVSGAFIAYVSYTGSSWAGTINGATPAVNTWTHVAFVRSGNTWTLYVNGQVSGTPFTASGSVYTSTDSLVIGASTTTGTNAFAGQISNARVVKGTAVYTSAFSPPTAPLTAVTNTTLLTCQSSTFIDNSTNAFAITVNGNAYTGTLNNPFDSPVNYDIPALQYWSNYFDGTGDYLTIPELNIPASTSFTIEFWFYWSSAPSTYSMFISEDSGNTSKYIAYNVAGATLDMQMGGNALTVAYCSFTPTLNTWYHLAFVRNTNTAAIYVNGVAQPMTQATQSGAFLDVGTINYIGRWAGTSPYAVNGYMSNFRAVVGAAVYNSNFTVPTTPLTAIQNTQLLTCQSNRFVDNSISARAITRYGDTSVQAFSPFQPTEPYSTTSVGGSVYFDGSNSKLTTSANIDISGLFTIECWYNLTVNAGWFFTIGNLPVYVDVNTGQITLDKSSVGVQLTTTANEQAKGKNCWKHLAITRDSGGVIRVFVNGILVGSVTTSYSAGVLNGLGAYANYGGNIAGYISDFRVIAGSALYTSNFVPPTAPLTAVSGTSLLVSAINGGITDATAKNDLETVGNAQISTAQSKFGGSSMLFDGSGDYLQAPNTVNANFGSGNFTIEFWMYASSQAIAPIVHQTSYASSQGWILWNYDGVNTATSTRKLTLMLNGASFILTTSSDAYANNTWTHIAVVKNGTGANNIKIYSNGSQIAAGTYSTALNNATTPFMVGGIINGVSWNGTHYYNGYLDDLRVTNGYARYTTNFTPPTSAFPLY